METPNVNVGALAVDLIENEGGGVSAHKPHTRVDVTGGQFTGRGRIHVTDNGRNVNTDVQAGEIMLDIAGKYVQQSRGTSCDDHHGQNGFTDSTDAEEGADEGFDLAVTKATFCPPSSQCPAGLRESNGETFDWSAGGDTNGCTQIGVPTGQRLGKYQPGGCPSKECVSCSKPESPDFNRHQTRVFPKHRLGECEEGKLANGGFHISNVSLDRRGEDAAVCCPKNSADSRTATDPIQNVAQIHDSPIQDPCTDTPSPVSSAKSHPDLNDDSLNSEPYTVAEEDENKDIFETTVPIRPKTLRTNPNLTVSLSCDATPLTPEEDGGFYFGDECYEEDFRNTLEAGRRQSAPDELPDLTGEAHSDSKLMPKRFGIAEFFTRSLFSRKSREPKPSHNASAWRLFNKPTSRESEAVKEPASPSSSTEQVDQQQDSSPSLSPQHPPATGRRKNLEFEPLSTTALILEDRPSNLPAKSLEETQRHKQEYEEMVAGAKKRELKEAQKKKRQMKERHKQEDIISNAMVIWNTEILPNWDSMKGTRRVRELWWQGLPPSVRGRVWSLAIGNELNITPELYEIFLSRAKEKWRSYSETSSVNDSESDGGASLADRESSLDLIKLDISRTFPSLFIFQKGGPYHDLLHSVLGAYTCYRPDIGYVQGMSFIAAVLILNLEEADAFITFANLLNKPCQMAFFRVDHELMLKYFSVFEVFFEENLPRLFSHFQTNSLTPDLYLIDWIFTLYSKSLPLDVACRVWDVFCRDGEESLFRTGLGILRLFEDVLLQMDFIHIAQFLTRLPEDLQSHTLFAAMANTHMVSRNRRWAQVFSTLMKDGNKEMEKSGSPALRS